MLEALLACSGPGAAAYIRESIAIGQAHAAATGALLAGSLVVAGYARRWVVPAILLGLVVLHPTWTVSAIAGDCGHMLRDASEVVTVISCALFGWQVTRTAWAGRRRPPTEPRVPWFWEREHGGIPLWLWLLIGAGVLILCALLFDALGRR